MSVKRLLDCTPSELALVHQGGAAGRDCGQ